MAIFLKVAIPAPLDRLFDYLPPKTLDATPLMPGQRVEVPFGRGRKIGVILELTETTAVAPERLREVCSVLDLEPLLGDEDLKLLTWASRYYHYPVGEAMATATSILAGKQQSAVNLKALFLKATAEGLEASRAESIKGRRQTELLRILSEHPEGILAAQLAELHDTYKSSARTLVKNGLAVWLEQPVPEAQKCMTVAEGPLLNDEQSAAVAAIVGSLGQYQAFLLEGVTGSGKTEVYLRAVEAMLAKDLQVMILLPEISLTPQLEARFRKRFGAPLVVYHSGLSEAQRRAAWLAMQRGEAAIILGTRSAVFTPMRSPGLIILDEEHDGSFKQQEGFRFSARDVAVMRARISSVPVVLGSATPALESLFNVEQGRYGHLLLRQRAGGAAAPRFRLLDIRGQSMREGISGRLTEDIRNTLQRSEQCLLFVNRRGFAPTLICHDCGWVAGCRHCDANLVIHAGDERLCCHHCGHAEKLTWQCRACGSSALRPLGLGTERVEAVLAELFPDARIARIDRDSTKGRGRLRDILNSVVAGDVDILVGTQMLAKGHHFPNVTLVGILDVDAGLFSSDFRAMERMAQVITQVAGRAGRESRPGSVVLQTRHPTHPLLQTLAHEGFSAAARLILAERRAAGLPPFAHQCLWRAESKDAASAQLFLAALAETAARLAIPGVMVLGPAPAPLARRGGRHRWQLLLQGPERRSLHGLIDELLAFVEKPSGSGRVRWTIDVDPLDVS